MESSDNNSSGQTQALSLWHRSAIGIAWVAAVFSAITIILMLGNYIRDRGHQNSLEEMLENLKIKMTDRPDDEGLVEEVRLLDLNFRQVRARWVDFSRTGGYLLLASLAVLVLAIKWAGTFRKKMSAPQEGAADEQIRQAVLARRSVTAALVLMGVVVFLLIISPHIDFSATDEPDDSYPTPEQISRNWHRFRGPEGAGVSAYANVPDNWDGKSEKAILWKSEVPVSGFNSPVVWGDKVFLSGGDPNRLNVFCFDAASGDLLWTGDVKRAPLKPGEEEVEVMEDTGYSAPTLTTDGKRVYAIFITGDVACFDFSGRNLWTRSLGIPDSVYGYSASLEMYRNLLLIQFDQGDVEAGISKLIALEGSSGQVVWQTKRPVGNSWASPILAQTENGPQIITAADPWVIAYEPEKGAEIWRAKCLTGDVAPSPIYTGGLTINIEPYSKMVAIKTDGAGDVSKTHIVWSLDDPAPDICCPVSDGKFVFFLTSDGLLMCHEVADGKKVWEQELEDDFRASPSLVGDKLYLLDEKGVMIIARAGAEYKELTRCELGEKCYASPAFGDGRIYLRGLDNLYCIGTETTKKP